MKIGAIVKASLKRAIKRSLVTDPNPFDLVMTRMKFTLNYLEVRTD